MVEPMINTNHNTAPASSPVQGRDFRQAIVRAWPALRPRLGLILIAISGVSTVIGVPEDLAPLMARLVADQYVPAGWAVALLGYVLGLLVAAGVVYGQVTSSTLEKWHWYAPLLIVDVRYTFGMFRYVVLAFGGGLLAYTIGLLLAAAVSHFGEQLAFGGRRKGWLKRLILGRWGQV